MCRVNSDRTSGVTDSRRESRNPRRGIAAHLIEVVAVDVLSWSATQSVPQTRASDVVQIGPYASDGERVAGVPASRARHVPAFLARGDAGYLAQVDGRFAGWVWVSARSHRDPWSGLRIQLTPRERYAYALYVAPEYRPHGVAAALVARLLTDMQADPLVSRVYGMVDATNKPSQTLFRLMFGFRGVQRAKRVRVLGLLGFQLPGSVSGVGPLRARVGTDTRAEARA